MQPFHCKKGSLDNYIVLHTKKTVVVLRTVRLWHKNASSVALL